MTKKSNDYFKLLEQQVEFSMQASDYLCEILPNYSAADIAQQRIKMHDIEQKADDCHHDILAKLSKEFITPIDQADLLRLVQFIDEITDALDEVILSLYMFHIDTIPRSAIVLAEKVNQCVKAFKESIAELKNFKKPELLRKLLVKVNTIESEADAIYEEAIYQAFRPHADIKNIIGIKAIYDSLENCCDLCEDASDVIEEIIMRY